MTEYEKNFSQPSERPGRIDFPPEDIDKNQLDLIWATYIESEGKDPNLDRKNPDEQHALIEWLERQRTDLIQALRKGN